MKNLFINLIYEIRFRWMLWRNASHYKGMLSGFVRECFVYVNGMPQPCEVRPRQQKHIDDPNNLNVRLRVMGAGKEARVNGSSWSPEIDVRATYPMSKYVKAVGKLLGIRRRLFESKQSFYLRVDTAALQARQVKGKK